MVPGSAVLVFQVEVRAAGYAEIASWAVRLAFTIRDRNSPSFE
jgi:hypothetical protein